MANGNFLAEEKSVLWTVLSQMKLNLGLWNFLCNAVELDFFYYIFQRKPIICITARSIDSYRLVFSLF